VRVTLLGQAASVLVEMAGAACLMDPAFFDPFEEGAVVSCPARVVHPERIPAIDIVIVSPRHCASVSRYPRRMEIAVKLGRLPFR
jgi:L-ascorbate metabolism protein UlaG (beta-lactamase superfamily)